MGVGHEVPGVGGAVVEIRMCIGVFVVYVGGESGVVYFDLDIEEGNGGFLKQCWRNQVRVEKTEQTKEKSLIYFSPIVLILIFCAVTGSSWIAFCLPCGYNNLF